MVKLGRLEKRAMLSEKHAEEGVKRAKLVLEHVDMEGKRDYLELGCGGGHVVRYMASEHGLRCTGTDVDPEMIRNAESRTEGSSNVRYLTADATDLPFEDASFDLALSFNILHHIGNWPDAIAEVHRVLRPGGDYVLGDLAYSKFSNWFFSPFLRNYGIYTIDGLVERAEEVGLVVTWRSPPQGSWFKYHALVLRKGRK